MSQKPSQKITKDSFVVSDDEKSNRRHQSQKANQAKNL
jgi:hypothetical protein